MADRIDLPTGMPHGQAKELADSQAQVGAIPQDLGLNDPQPGPSIQRPTEAPDESLFAGADFGPGPGPEALVRPDPVTDPDEEILSQMVPMLEAITDNRRHSTSAMRQTVRRMRSKMPPE
jgi:hypothetical protein